MAGKIEFERAAQKELEKLDKTVVRRILKFLYQRVGKLDDPRRIGERLQGPLSEFWKYRVGAYRIICSLENNRLVVLVLSIGHRREVYKRWLEQHSIRVYPCESVARKFHSSLSRDLRHRRGRQRGRQRNYFAAALRNRRIQGTLRAVDDFGDDVHRIELRV